MDVAHTDIAIFFKSSPLSCLYKSSICEADWQPTLHADSVGRPLESTEKKFLPVGKASVLPLVGAPDGPLFTYCPFNELINDNFSLYEELMIGIRISFFNNKKYLLNIKH